MRTTLLSALAASILLAACAQSDAEPMATDAGNKDCFWLSEVSGFNKAGRDKILVHTGPSETYLFETMGHCPDLNFSETLAFDQKGPGQICRGIDVDLIVPSHTTGPRRCPVRMIKKLTKEEAKAY